MQQLIAFGLCVALVGCSASHTANTSESVATCSPSPQTNKAVVLSFYQEALVDRQPRSGFERYMSPDFIEHKPDIAGGTREATISYIEQLIKDVPDLRWEVLRTAAESDLVILHGRFTPAAGAPAYAVADVFRLRNCLIVEHWDIVGPPREQQPNPNSRF